MRCKPGDLAWIVQSPDAPENLWKLVRVQRPHPDYVGAWACEALQLLSGFKLGTKVGVLPGEICGIDDKWLKPLPPDEGAEEVNKEMEAA